MANKIIRRVIAIIPALVLQVLWLFVLTRWLLHFATLLEVLLSVLSVLLVLYIIINRHESTYKILWLLLILSFPILGAILYLCVGNQKTARPIRKRVEYGRSLLPESRDKDDTRYLDALAKSRPRLAQTFGYIEKKTGYSTQPCQETEYYPLGENMHARMLEDLETAEHYIFAEYFIIQNGVMWDSMVEIMTRKAAAGVDVRVMFDDLGSIATYSRENVRQLREKGIKCVPFNPMYIIKGTLNNRDHRKMLIIDGRVAYSGGVNLADEYINVKKPYGHWKDIGFRLTGAPVKNYIRMFAEFWNAYSREPIPAEILEASQVSGGAGQSDGYVLSYYDSPFYRDAVSNNLYEELLSMASGYAWFYTPYLMLGDSLMDAFVRAAQRGVDVRIIMPGIPDKAMIYRMSRSYYRPLLEAGVRIYEYTPGFVHAKGCIVDDIVGTVGTVNLDYRSLFLHFENNALFCETSLLKDLKADHLATQEQCRERTLDDMGKGFWKWTLDGVLRIFAPLC